jgi:uncharacterized protein with FMN-binding domain
VRRAVLVVIATVAGLVILLHYKSTPVTVSNRITPGVPGTASTAPAGAAPPDSAQPGNLLPGEPAAPSTPSSTAPSRVGSANGRVTGTDVPTRFGDVQVEVTLSNGRITEVQALLLPNDRARSSAISQEVAPILRQEVLDAQSSQIDTVSGATYTSEGYAESLQAALDKAGA